MSTQIAIPEPIFSKIADLAPKSGLKVRQINGKPYYCYFDSCGYGEAELRKEFYNLAIANG